MLGPPLAAADELLPSPPGIRGFSSVPPSVPPSGRVHTSSRPRWEPTGSAPAPAPTEVTVRTLPGFELTLKYHLRPPEEALGVLCEFSAESGGPWGWWGCPQGRGAHPTQTRAGGLHRRPGRGNRPWDAGPWGAGRARSGSVPSPLGTRLPAPCTDCRVCSSHGPRTPKPTQVGRACASTGGQAHIPEAVTDR